MLYEGHKLTKKSVIDIFQLRSLSEERFIKKIGTISEVELAKVKEALKMVFDME